MATQSEVITNFVPWTDPSKHTAAFKIFKYHFMCSMAQMHLQDAKVIEKFGYVTSGNSAVDRAIAETKTHVQLSIAAMAHYHDQGVPFHIVDPRDSVKIYQIIHQHLQDWHQRLLTNINAVAAPMEDLRKLDELAAEVYQVARPYMAAQRPFHGQLHQFLEGMLRNRHGVSRTPGAPTQPAAPVVASSHTSMADMIASQLRERRKVLNPSTK